MRLRTWVSAGVVLLLAASGVATAEGTKETKETKKAAAGKDLDPQAMMAAYEKAGEPTEQHKLLQRSVGKWTITIKSWMDPNQPPMESKGTAEGRALLGGRFVQQDVVCDMMGKPFSGVSVNGYDRGKKKFVGTWIDSMSTGVMRSEGTTDASGNTMTVQAVSTDPMTGKDSKLRIVGTWEGNDKLVEQFFEKKKGKEKKTMEITYLRAK